MYFDFECPRCGMVIEKESNRPLPDCTACGVEMFRVFTVPAIKVAGGTQTHSLGSGPRFDMGLGCMVKDDKDAGEIAKRRGLTVREPDVGEEEAIAEMRHIKKAGVKGREAREAQQEVTKKFDAAISKKQAEIVSKKLGKLDPAGLDIGS